MNEDQAQLKKITNLRWRAEKAMHDQPVDLTELSTEDIRRLVHELQVHQVELEMKNEELRQAQQELAESRDKYADLYDFAPVGYFTISEEGLILEANLTGATMLGVERDDLIKQPLPRFIVREDQDSYYLHQRDLFQAQTPQVCEIRLVKKDASQFYARIEAIVVQDSEGDTPVCRTVMSDVTEQMQTKEVLRKSEEKWRSLVENAPERIITLRMRIEETLRQRTAQLEALREVGLEITAQLDLDALLHSIASWALEMVGGISAGVCLYRPEQDVLETIAVVGVTITPIGSTLRQGESLSGRVWETGEPVVVDDYRHWEGQIAAYQELPIGAMLGVPICWGEAFLGVLSVVSDSPHAFTQADAELLNLFATQAAIAIRNARLYETEQKRATQLAVVNQVARKAVSILDPDQLLQEIIIDIQEGFKYHNMILLLLNESTGELGSQAIAGGFEDIAPPDYWQKVGEGLIGWTAETGQPLMVNNVSQDPRYIVGFREEVSTKSELCVPLSLGDQVIGVLDVQETRLNAFDETDLTAMETLADQIAVAIKNARLYHEAQQELTERKRAEEALQQRNRELALLNQVSQTFVSTLDIDQVLVTVLEEVRHLLDVTACSIWLDNPETGELVCHEIIGPQNEVIRDWYLSLAKGLASRAVRSGESLIVPDTRTDERYFKGADEQTGLVPRSNLSVPLRVKNNVIGVLQVVDTAVGRFSSTDLALLEPLAVTAAIAIENARLYEQTRQDAEVKATLLREVNHRVQNNLAAIISLLNLEKDRTGVDQTMYQAIMQNLISRIRGLAAVHRLLSATGWAPLCLSELAEQVIDSALQVLPRDKYVFVDVSPSAVCIAPGEANDLALVINELVTNSIKYAWPASQVGHIAVHIDRADDWILFEFRDDGRGYPEEVLRWKRYNIGLELIQSMMGYGLEGEMILSNDQGAVTTIRFKTM